MIKKYFLIFICKKLMLLCFKKVYSGPNGVIALAGNRDLYHRVNMKEVFP